MADWDVHAEDFVETRPRFCPRCEKPGPADATLCPACGDTLADRGYCEVCSRHWLLRAGEPCPKHDVPLEETAAPPLRSLEGEFTDWVSVAAFHHPNAAEAPRIRLEAEGIPTFLEGERVGGHGLYGVATGGVRLQVPRELAHEARVVLSQTWTSAAEPDDDLDDAWDDLAPEPGATRRTVMRAIIVLILMLPLMRLLLSLIAGD
jgi:hypothetical protein